MSRKEAPNGGVSDQIIDLRKAGYQGVGGISRVIGVALTGGFIVVDLGVKPGFCTRTAMYWAPEQIPTIRRALIMKLLRDSESDVEPNASCAHLAPGYRFGFL